MLGQPHKRSHGWTPWLSFPELTIDPISDMTRTQLLNHKPLDSKLSLTFRENREIAPIVKSSLRKDELETFLYWFNRVIRILLVIADIMFLQSTNAITSEDSKLPCRVWLFGCTLQCEYYDIIIFNMNKRLSGCLIPSRIRERRSGNILTGATRINLVTPFYLHQAQRYPLSWDQAPNHWRCCQGALLLSCWWQVLVR